MDAHEHQSSYVKKTCLFNFNICCDSLTLAFMQDTRRNCCKIWFHLQIVTALSHCALIFCNSVLNRDIHASVLSKAPFSAFKFQLYYIVRYNIFFPSLQDWVIWMKLYHCICIFFFNRCSENSIYRYNNLARMSDFGLSTIIHAKVL